MIPRALLALLICLFLTAPAQSADYEAAFSPRGKSLQLVLSTIQSAQKTIRVAAYRFNSTPVATALADASRRGVDVKVVADKQANSGRYTAVTFLARQGVPVRLNDNYPVMHHTFILVDGIHLQTGYIDSSEAAASKNAKNVLVLRDEPVMVEQYAAEWNRMWEEGRDAGQGY